MTNKLGEFGTSISSINDVIEQSNQEDEDAMVNEMKEKIANIGKKYPKPEDDNEDGNYEEVYDED